MSKLSNLKASVRRLEHADSFALRAAYLAIRQLWRVQLLLDASNRSVFITGLTAGDQMHQRVNATKPDRYPEVFNACAAYFSQNQAVRILSFGCSTGEEVFSLRQYFPHAALLGVDINRRNIRVARASRQKDASMNFATELPEQGQYDAIFCMAVLQRTENRLPDTTDSSNIYPYSRFDAQVTLLDTRLRVGGVFAIDCADYRFEDAGIAAKYLPLENSPSIQRNRPVFDRNNQRSSVPYCNPRVFRKIA